MRSRARGRFWLIAFPYVWLLIFFLAPFVIVAKIALSDTAIAIPPYVPVFDLGAGISGLVATLGQLDFESFRWLLEDNLYWVSYLSSLRIAAISTVLTLFIGYPVAYALAKSPERWRWLLVTLVILPFWTSFLIRVYAWIGILKNEGLLNGFLIWIGLLSEPLTILHTNTAVYIGIVYSYLPFMILPLYASLERIDGRLLEAAADLGARPVRAFWQVTAPLSLPGVVAGCFLVFIPAIGEFVIPDLLGGSETLMIGKTLWTEFFNNRDWPVASAVAVVLVLLLVVPIMIFQRTSSNRMGAG